LAVVRLITNCRRLLYRKLRRFSALQDFVYEDSGAAVHLGIRREIGPLSNAISPPLPDLIEVKEAAIFW